MSKVVIIDQSVTDNTFLTPVKLEYGVVYEVSVTAMNNTGNSPSRTVSFIPMMENEHDSVIDKIYEFLKKLIYKYELALHFSFSEARKIKKMYDEFAMYVKMYDAAKEGNISTTALISKLEYLMKEYY